MKWGLFAIVVIASALRCVWLSDMEYKWDEFYTFNRIFEYPYWSHWPVLGMPASAGMRNAGMSLWVFLLGGRIFSVESPLQMVAFVGGLNTLAFGLCAGFIWNWVLPAERKIWIWGLALAAVNPISVTLQRKIWAPSVFPVFSVLFLMAWWRRDRYLGAFFWGLLGALLGQIQLAAHFFSLAFVVWTALFEKKRRFPKHVKWRAWLAGSIIGALPLVPWFRHVLFAQNSQIGLGQNWNWLQPKFWWYWITDGFGLSLQYHLGFRGFLSFLKYPYLGEFPSYGAGLVSVLVLAVSIQILFLWFKRWKWQKKTLLPRLVGLKSQTDFAVGAAVVGFGLLLTLSTAWATRHYLIVTFPLIWVWVAKIALSEKRGHHRLAALWLGQLILTLTFLGYIHFRGGEQSGPYGPSYKQQVLDGTDQQHHP